MRRGAKVAGAHTVSYLRSRESGTDARFGFIVSKKVGTAVRRNLVRRRLKAVCHEALADGVQRRRRRGARAARCRRGRVGRRCAPRCSTRSPAPHRAPGRAREGSSDVRDLALFIVLIPRNLGVLLLRAYRAVISPLYGDVCRYYPSCSAYGLGSVQQHGLLVGTALTAWRIVRCNPWTRRRHRRRAPGSPRPLPHHDLRLGRAEGHVPERRSGCRGRAVAHELEHRPPTTRRRASLAPAPARR